MEILPIYAKKYLKLLTLSSTLVMVACGGSDDEATNNTNDRPKDDTPPKTEPVANTRLLAQSYTSTDGQEQTLQIANTKGATIDYVVVKDNTNSYVKQAVTRDIDGSQIRTIFNTNGDIERIVNDISGDFSDLHWQTNRLIITNHDKSGKYINGHVISYDEDGKLGIAEIIGTPSFSGQLVGNLQNSSDPGAFALTPKNQISEVNIITGTFHVLPDEYQAEISIPVSNLKTNYASTSSVSDESSPFATVANWFNYTVPAWTQNNKSKLLTGAVMGSALILGGAIPVGIGVTATSLSLLIGGYVAQEMGQTLINDLAKDINHDGIFQTTLIQRMRDASANGWLNGQSWADTIKNTVQQIKQNGLNQLPKYNDVKSSLSQATSSLQTIVTNTVVSGQIPIVKTPVTGILGTNSGETYELDGDVDVNGKFKVIGYTQDQSKQINLEGTIDQDDVSGLYTGTNGAGNFTGTNNTLGACSSRQESGGQGSFTYAYQLGAQKGDVYGWYDMYGIPDRMDIYILQNGQRTQAFTTGGLVSDYEDFNFKVAPYTTAFVTMTAPNDGTAWDFEIGCPN